MTLSSLLRTFSTWLTCCLALLICSASYANVHIDEHFRQHALAPDISYICDNIANKTLDEVKALTFAPLTRQEISFSFTQSDCWFHFQATNTSDRPMQLVLSSDFNAFDHIDFYIPSAGIIITKSIGDTIPYSQRELKLRTLAIPFTINAKENNNYYIHAKTSSTYYLPLQLSSYPEFINNSNKLDSLIGLIYGIVIGLFLYHLFLFIITREKVQLLYIFYVMNTLFFFAAEQGSLFRFWPNATALNNYSIYTLAFLVFSSACLFTRTYLHTKESPRLHKFLKWSALLFAFSAFFHVLIPTHIVAPIMTSSGLLVIFLLFFISIKRWLDGLNEAKIFIISWGLLIVTGAYFIILLLAGGSDISNALVYTQIAFAAQQVLLSIGLAQRLKTLQKEKESKEQEMLLAQAESAAKTEFLARMSHEIRTPMNAVIGVTQLLDATSLTAYQQNYINLLKNSGQLLLSIIDDILDYSKITSGNINLEQTPFDIQMLIKNVYDILSANNEEKPVELICDISDDFPHWIESDPTRLRQVLFNLLSNALKFTANGHVSLHAQRIVQINKDIIQVQITISDTGIGLTSEQMDSLFSAFHQADASITRKYGGTGLGLAISKQIIELMGGSIHVSSKIGQGTSFVILLPLRITQELVTISDPVSAPMAWAADLSKLNVLLTEDNAVNQLIIISLIKQLGIEAKLAKNGEEAFTMISQNHNDFDVILMDCEMPILDGLQATRKIRQWEQQQNLKPITIIALTAHALPEYQIRCREAGMNDYMTKPLLLPELAEKLQRLLPSTAQ